MRVNYFDEPVAKHYDDAAKDLFDPAVVDPTVDFLAGLAGAGDALEFGIGTGRIALPLSARGVRVSGIDLSPAMVSRLHAKPGADAIEVTVGDYVTTFVGQHFSLVFVVFNTIVNVTSQDGQVDAFCNAAAHLEPGGHFVIELGVPDLRRLLPGERFQMFDASESHVGFDEYIDIPAQLAVSHHWYRAPGIGVESLPWRWAWPSELDLMARVAGMRLSERWADWDRAPFTGESKKHISVWEKPA